MTPEGTGPTVGIPRTLLYYSFYPLWRRFLEELGARVVTSAQTTKETLDAGVATAVTDACVPIKVMHGHVMELVRRGVDYLFLPRVVCTNGRTVYCPKFLGLPDMVRSSVGSLPKMIDVRVDLRRGRAEASRVALLVGRLFTNQTGRVRRAWTVARAELARYKEILRGGVDPEMAMGLARTGASPTSVPLADALAPLRLAVIGYPYVLHDPFLNLNLLKKLQALGVTPLTSQMVSEEDLAAQRAKLHKDLFWTYSDEAVSAAYHYLERPDEVDGLIHLTAFGCGPDSMVDKMIELRARECRAVPFMSLMIDEHTGEAGLSTRLEAFADMLRRRKRPVLGAETGTATASTTHAPQRGSRAPATTDGTPSFLARRKRVVTFPYAGNLPPVLAELVTALGNEVAMPPRPTQRTLTLGAAHAPEFACLPLKILLGTYLEALEQGADTIMSTGGVGPCRAGLYTQLQELVLRQMGHRVDVITLEPPRTDLRDFLTKIQALNARGFPAWKVVQLVWRAWQKQVALDGLERLSHHVRARQLVPRATTPVYEEALRLVHTAATRREIEEAFRRGEALLAAVPQKTGFQPLKVGIVGEIYVLIEPSSNLEIEETLGDMGVEVERSIYLSGWARESNLLGKPGEGKRIKAKDLAQPYLGEMIGGHGQDSVGNAVMFGQSGYDGVIQLAPFTCIPEIVAKSVLERVSRDFSLPVLSISLDEQTGKAGLMTRLEAFVDLLARRRAAGAAGGRRGRGTTWA